MKQAYLASYNSFQVIVFTDKASVARYVAFQYAQNLGLKVTLPDIKTSRRPDLDKHWLSGLYVKHTSYPLTQFNEFKASNKN